MEQESRTQSALKNGTVTIVATILKMVTQFFVRSLFIYFLGKKLLGLNGLLTSLVAVLSLAELGIGPSISFVLYKPLVERNIKKTLAIMQLYKKAFNIIALLIALVGLAIMPLLPNFIKDTELSYNLYAVYSLFLLNTVVSYSMAYYRGIFDADQQASVNQINFAVFYLLTGVVQGIVLVFNQNLYIYLIIQVISTICSNLVIRTKARKKYLFLKNIKSPKLKVDKETIKILYQNIVGNFSNSIGYIVVSTTDNIFISKFLSLALVGIYSNYVLVVNAASNVFTMGIRSVTANIGHFGVNNKNHEKGLEVYNRLSFVTFFTMIIIVTELIILLNPFMSFWIGTQYVLPRSTVLIIIINISIALMRNPNITFINAYGLAWRQRWKSFVEALLNVCFTVIFLLVFDLGLNGILLGTLVSTAIIMLYEPYIVFKFGLKVSLIKFLKPFIIKIIILICFVIVCNNLVIFNKLSFFAIVVTFIIVIFIDIAMLCFAFYHTRDFRYFYNLCKNMLLQN